MGDVVSLKQFRRQESVYLDAPLDKHILVTGPPGTGKTVIAFLRARTLANARKKNAWPPRTGASTAATRPIVQARKMKPSAAKSTWTARRLRKKIKARSNAKAGRCWPSPSFLAKRKSRHGMAPRRLCLF